jgi:ribulose-5-phosphate 4-epimerase/fuculose-1-phosphate aldolase
MTTTTTAATREEVASVARLIAAAGLVEAFGHVSARTDTGFMLTATTPLGAATAEEVHDLGVEVGTDAHRSSLPLEAPLHAAIYRARPDVGAVCRTHSPAMVAFGARGAAPPRMHGLGGLSGEVSVCTRVDLVASPDAGEAVTTELGPAACLVMRANGGLATGVDLAQAAVRAYFLEERCRVALHAGDAGEELSGEDRQARERWHEGEEARAWRWLLWKFGRSGATQGNNSE